MAIAFQLIVMGVSGCGKSTVAEALAQHYHYPFIEGDAHHPAANIDKMKHGTPLDDADRQGWLVTLNQLLQQEKNGAVLSCSALKPEYRATLAQGVENPFFVYLKGDFDTMWARLQQRQTHFFQGRHMLQNQFDTLIEPSGNNVIVVDTRLSVADITQQVVAALASIEPQ